MLVAPKPKPSPVVQSQPVKLSVLLPVRNEGINLRIMLRMLPVVIDVPHEVLVIVDSPDDESIAVVKDRETHSDQLRLVENRIGRGVVNALRAGVQAAQGEYCLIFAADEVGPLLAVVDMLELMEEGCDFVSCTRYAHGGRRLGGSFLGGLLSRSACFLLHTIGGSVFTDASTGIKIFRREVFDRLGLESKPVGWVVAFEMAIKAQLLGLRLGEVPIISVDRLYGGKSTFRLWPWIKAYLRWFIWGCRHLRKGPRSQVKVRIPLHNTR
jgi:glycosyltransferase involved in cell wall biosynthesis